MYEECVRQQEQYLYPYMSKKLAKTIEIICIVLCVEGGPGMAMYCPKRNSESMGSLIQQGKERVIGHPQLEYYENKKPRWLEPIQAYSLDFQGRVTLPSNKNFQLIRVSSLRQ